MEFIVGEHKMLEAVLLNEKEVKVVIPESVRSIKGGAFYNKIFIQEIILPTTLKLINSRAFESCESLQEINIPDLVYYIGSSAFKNCKNLRSVHLPDTFLSIDSEMFSHCFSLKEINIPKSLTRIGDEAFRYTAIEKLNLQQEIEIIGRHAFASMYDLKTIKLPSCLKEIKQGTFKDCESLKRIEFPTSLKTIETSAFCGCNSLEEITLPDSIDFIGEDAFSYMRNLKMIKLPKNLHVIKESTFKCCESLKSIELPVNLKKIENGAFRDCTSLERIELPDSVEIIMNGAFENCTLLKEITLSNSLKEIKPYSFEKTNIKTIIIPNSVSSIGIGAFKMSRGEEIYLGDNCTRIYEEAFQGCTPQKIRIGNFLQLKQPGVIEILDSINYFYINKVNGEILGFNQPQTDLVDYEEICYEDWYRNLGKDEYKGVAIILSLITQENKKYVKNDNLRRFFLNIIKLVNRANYKEIKKSLENSKAFFEMVKRTYYYKEMNANFHYNSVIYADLFTLAYTLGAFSDNQIERQKACEFLYNAIDKKELNFGAFHGSFESLKFKGHNREWAEFFMNKKNFSELLKLEEEQDGYMARIYNSFDKIKEFGRSNRGSQRYRKVTIEMCNDYLATSTFEGVDEITKDISQTISAYTRNQESFDLASEIRKNYCTLKNEGKINDHILGEELKEIKKEIIKETNETISNLNDISNDKFSYEFLSKYDPKNFVLGKYCSCCAHLEGAGFGIMKASILHPDCQNLAIKNTRGKIVAKSTLYINRSKGYGLLNNFEVNNNIKSEEDLKLIYLKFKQAIETFANKYNELNKENPLVQINVGMGLNDLSSQITKKDKAAYDILPGICFSKYGNTFGAYDGDWQENQYIIWRKENETKIIR